MMRKSSWILGAGAVSAIVLLISCGGKDEDGGPTQPTNPRPVGAATATPVPTTVPTATPQPATPSPTPEPEEDQNPGPVTAVVTRVFVVRDKQGGTQIPGKYEASYPGTPYYDPTRDTETVCNGCFFIIDTTPKNAAGQKCQADRPPQWIVNHGGKFEPLGNNGIGSNPFQYRANARSKGKVEVYTFVDNVRSNVITVEII